MNCERCRELFPEVIGEELNSRLSEEFQKHLADCPDCCEELDLLGRTKSALKAAWPEEAIPETFTFGRSGRAAVEGSVSSFWRQPNRMAWLGLAAAACLVVCLGTLSILNARVEIGQGSFSLSFRPEFPSHVFQQVAPASDSVSVALVEARLSRLMDRQVSQLEETWEARLQQIMARTQSQWSEQRSVDLRQVNRDLGYLLRLQEVMRQETVRNEVLISSVADRYLPGPTDSVAQ